MNESLYALSSTLMAAVLFASMVVAVEAGHRAGRRRSPSAHPPEREHVNGVQTAMLGLLALLLAFTLSLSLQRFDSRSEAVVDEANAIGTTLLRSDLLPAPLRDAARRALGGYIDLRVHEATLALPDHEARAKADAAATRAQAEIWGLALRAVQLEPQARGPVLFVEAVNTMIDSYGRRDAALNRHVPEVVLLLLYGSYVLTGGVVGFAAGLAGHRPSRVTYVLLALIVVVAFIVVDLDRPRRGLIRVDPASLLSLQAAIARDPAVGRGALPAALPAASAADAGVAAGR